MNKYLFNKRFTHRFITAPLKPVISAHAKATTDTILDAEMPFRTVNDGIRNIYNSAAQRPAHEAFESGPLVGLQFIL